MASDQTKRRVRDIRLTPVERSEFVLCVIVSDPMLLGLRREPSDCVLQELEDRLFLEDRKGLVAGTEVEHFPLTDVPDHHGAEPDGTPRQSEIRHDNVTLRSHVLAGFEMPLAKLFEKLQAEPAAKKRKK